MHNIPASIQTEVAYLNAEWRDRSALPRIYSRKTRQANTSRRSVAIQNARPRHDAGELSLDGSGFILVDHATTFTDYRDKAAVLKRYLPKMCQVLRELTGADDAFAFPFYQVRSKSPEHFFDAYSLYMHCDFRPDTWLEFAQQILQRSGASGRYPSDGWDFAIYNMWRPIGNEVQKDPLAVMDASTCEREDLVNYLVSDNDRDQAALPLFNERQRLYYVPRIRPDEVLVFKQLDSRSGRALVCPHAAFVDPTAPADALERESIDIRVMCVFQKGLNPNRPEQGRPGARSHGAVSDP